MNSFFCPFCESSCVDFYRFVGSFDKFCFCYHEDVKIEFYLDSLTEKVMRIDFIFFLVDVNVIWCMDDMIKIHYPDGDHDKVCYRNIPNLTLEKVRQKVSTILLFL